MSKIFRIDEKCTNIDRNNRKYSRAGAYVHTYDMYSRLLMSVFVALSQDSNTHKGIYMRKNISICI